MKTHQLLLERPLQLSQPLLQLPDGLKKHICDEGAVGLHEGAHPSGPWMKAADPVLVTELLLQLSVDLLDGVQVVHRHAAILSIHTRLRALELLRQGVHLHLQVRDLARRDMRLFEKQEDAEGAAGRGR